MKILGINSFIIMALVLLALSSPQEKPRILIIGDSISIGYTPFVKKDLANKAHVFHNPGNAEHTGTGLKKIEEWIGSKKWDIIQVNWGLWDLCYRHSDSKVQGNRDKKNGTITYTIDEYASNLDSIVTILKTKTQAKLVFVTTTYIPENEAGRFQKDAIRYNDVAKKIMKKNGVIVNDLYEPSISIHKEFGKGIDDVHFTESGYKRLGEEVSGFLKKELE
jgi:lysophospholipase L1-like esterase